MLGRRRLRKLAQVWNRNTLGFSWRCAACSTWEHVIVPCSDGIQEKFSNRASYELWRKARAEISLPFVPTWGLKPRLPLTVSNHRYKDEHLGKSKPSQPWEAKQLHFFSQCAFEASEYLPSRTIQSKPGGVCLYMCISTKFGGSRRDEYRVSRLPRICGITALSTACLLAFLTAFLSALGPLRILGEEDSHLRPLQQQPGQSLLQTMNNSQTFARNLTSSSAQHTLFDDQALTRFV